MQYREGGGQVELLTEEEWLMLQDVPFKEMLLERMGFQRRTNAVEETSQVLYQYADLLEQGMTPDDALMMTAQTLDQTRAGIPPEQQAMPPMGQPMGASAPMDSGAQIPMV